VEIILLINSLDRKDEFAGHFHQVKSQSNEKRKNIFCDWSSVSAVSDYIRIDGGRNGRQIEMLLNEVFPKRRRSGVKESAHDFFAQPGLSQSLIAHYGRNRNSKIFRNLV